MQVEFFNRAKWYHMASHKFIITGWGSGLVPLCHPAIPSLEDGLLLLNLSEDILKIFIFYLLFLYQDTQLKMVPAAQSEVILSL